MSGLEERNPGELKKNVFSMIGRDWMLIAAEKDGRVNAMTASWGGLGVLWGSDVAYIFVRQSRLTKEFIDASDTFSLNFLDPARFRDVQKYMGTVSGRDEDKVAKSGLQVQRAEQTPDFGESDTVLLCRKAGAFELGPDGIGEEDRKRWYADGDLHTMYVGRIVKLMTRAEES